MVSGSVLFYLFNFHNRLNFITKKISASNISPSKFENTSKTSKFIGAEISTM